MLANLIADLTNPSLWLVVLGLTIFGVADRLVFYYAGKRGGKAALDKVHGYTPERADQLHSLYERWGSFLLLITSVPVIGSSMTVLGGISDVAIPLFIVMAVISYMVRNWIIVFLSSGVVHLFS
jgi:membrane protein DedA with SNARE-associated domain